MIISLTIVGSKSMCSALWVMLYEFFRHLSAPLSCALDNREEYSTKRHPFRFALLLYFCKKDTLSILYLNRQPRKNSFHHIFVNRNPFAALEILCVILSRSILDNSSQAIQCLTVERQICLPIRNAFLA